jgi:hypothetical protein
VLNGYEGEDWIHFALDKVHWQALLNRQLIFRLKDGTFPDQPRQSVSRGLIRGVGNIT